MEHKTFIKVKKINRNNGTTNHKRMNWPEFGAGEELSSVETWSVETWSVETSSEGLMLSVSGRTVCWPCNLQKLGFSYV